MGAETKIEWTRNAAGDPGHTFNIAWGCDKVSPACKFCYAESLSKRWGFDVWGPAAPRRTFPEKHWREPLAWNAAAEKAGRVASVFCSSMCDLFEDHPTIIAELARLWPLIRATPHLRWLLLTKRAHRIAASLPADWGDGFPNVWLGVTGENQECLDERWAHLCRIPARVRFISAEPLLSRLDIEHLQVGACLGCKGAGETAGHYGTDDGCEQCEDCRGTGEDENNLGCQWVIVGGESGRQARPMHPDWPEDLRKHCTNLGISYFFKQWGEWSPLGPHDGADCVVTIDGRSMPLTRAALELADREAPVRGATRMYRVGKGAAGRLLAGREWNEIPEVMP